MKLPLKAPFSRETLSAWIAQNLPLQIEMSDDQYSWLANMERANVRKVGHIPIVFTDAPAPRI